MMGVLGTFACADHGVLSLEESAVGLSREGRFANQTILHWSVAEHLLSGLYYIRDLRPLLRLHWALHDVHETMTRDVPTDCKVKGVRILQQAIDKRLYAMVGVEMPNVVQKSIVKTVDADMLLAEASLVAPTRTYEKISSELGGRTALLTARQAVGWVLQQQWSVADTAAEWLRQVKGLLQEVKHGAH